MIQRLTPFFFLLFLLSCENKQEDKKSNSKIHQREKSNSDTTTKLHQSNPTFYKSATKLQDSLVDIQEINPSIKVDLKYATTDNFMRIRLYSRLNKAYLQHDVAERLSACQNYLKTLHSDYSLLVYDAARPVSVQQKMWNALDTIPVTERGKFVSNPKNRSLHNLGAAVDLTIIDGNGKPLDMGAGYDDIRKIAYPILEAEFLAKGELTEKHIANRKLLRQVMQHQQFRPLDTEWWHFNACSRPEGLKKYKVIFEEF